MYVCMWTTSNYLPCDVYIRHERFNNGIVVKKDFYFYSYTQIRSCFIIKLTRHMEYISNE